MTKGARCQLLPVGGDGVAAAWTTPQQEYGMLVTGKQESGLPIETVIGYPLLQTERTDLSGQIGQEKAAEQTHFEPWLLDR
jgi:hypothetical protein